MFRPCRNYGQENICNWTVEAEDRNPLCLSCRLTAVIPDLTKSDNAAAWYRLEVAKRRLLYTLLCLGLPFKDRAAEPQSGLAFQFLAYPPDPQGLPVLTGHNHGLITVNIAEADDAQRERRRLQMGEPYRTLLGHFRHEIGHFYWDQLIKGGALLERFRNIFGDESADYAQALQRHHAQGPPANWQDYFVSAYASAHPWEDWAETWAHYLHMVDALETAMTCGLSLRPKRKDEPKLKNDLVVVGCWSESFDDLIDHWFPLTYVLNNLNRGLGLQDGYPFVLSKPAIDKLRFVHEVVGASRGRA